MSKDYDIGFKDGSLAGYKLAQGDMEKFREANRERDQLRELCGELLKQLKNAADIDCPLIGSPSISELIDFWQHEKNEGRGVAQDMLDIYETITKAEKALGGES